MKSFKKFLNESEECNIISNELKPGDKVKNINPDCKHYKSTGEVVDVKKIKGKGGNAGNKIEYKIKNRGKNFKENDKVEKTEIQLKKL